MAYSPMRAVLPARGVLEPLTPRVSAGAPPRERLHRYPPRSYVVAPSPAPESSDDH